MAIIEEAQWGGAAIDRDEPSLPGLKARFLVRQLPEAGELLEVGCGDGRMLATVARYRPGLTTRGCDVRPTRGPVPFEFALVGPDGRLPYGDRSHDVVMLFDVLEHVSAPELTLAEVHRVLRPAGTLVAFVPVEGEPLSAYRLFRALLGDELYVETKEHVQAFTHHQLEALVAQRFVVRERAYAYHAAGQLMDAGFFAATRLKRLRRFWWKENAFYRSEHASKSPPGLFAAVANAAVRAANVVAYGESRALRGVRQGSAGVLLAATPR